MMPRCWHAAEALRVLATDAGNDADKPGTFAATHRPVTAVVRKSDDNPITVDDACPHALRRLTEPLPHPDPVIMPVLGEPGTGKSHLVRWAWTVMDSQADPSFCIVYIPRARMNVAGVVGRLLAAARQDPDAEVRAAAEQLITAAHDVFGGRTSTFVAREMLNEAAHRLSADVAARGDAALAQHLSDLLLEGGDAGDYLASERSAVGRKALDLVDGRPMGEERSAAFSQSEFAELNAVSRNQSVRFKNAIRAITTGAHGDQASIARQIDAAIEVAVAALLQRSGGAQGLSFGGVLRMLRESLHAAGRELVIFVEELKVLGGIERALLEGFLDTHTAIGERPICRVRALLACTRGEWDRLVPDIATLQTRLDAWKAPQYDLDTAFDPSLSFERDAVLRRLEDMAAYYMNAARVGVQALEAGYADANRNGEGQTWRPKNACTDCSQRPTCHGTFGAVPGPDGHDVGLFPYTRPALARAQDRLQKLAHVRSSGDVRPDAGRLEDGLNPRILIKQVLEPMLDLAAEEGPMPAYEIAVRLRAQHAPLEEMTRQIRTATGLAEEEAKRAAGATFIWGTPVDEDGELNQVADPIRVALALPGAKAVRIELEHAAERIVSPDRIKRPTTARDALAVAVDQWRNGEPLLQGPANRLRNLLHATIVDGMDIHPLAGSVPTANGIGPELGLQSAEAIVRLEDARTGERQVSSGGFEFRFARKDGHFVAAVASIGAQGFTGDVDDLVELAEGLDERRQAFARHAAALGIERGREVPHDHPGLVAALATTAAVGLDPGDVNDEPALLAALFATTPGSPQLERAGAATQRLAKYAREGRAAAAGDPIYPKGTSVGREAVRNWLLARFGYRISVRPEAGQAVHMIDGAALYAAVARAAHDATPAPLAPSAVDVSDTYSPAQAELARRTKGDFEAAVKEAIEHARPVVKSALPLLGLDNAATTSLVVTRLAATCEAIDVAYERIQDEGLAPPSPAFLRIPQHLALHEKLISDPTALDVLLEVAAAPERVTRRLLHRLFGGYGAYASAATVLGALGELELVLQQALSHARTFSGTREVPEIIRQFPNLYTDALERADEALASLPGQQHE
jgi:hypothetical protein